MLSPEPNFWMDAVRYMVPWCIRLLIGMASLQAIELARTEQVPQTKSKGKGKAKETSGQDAPLLPEYHDNSFLDSAIRAHLLRGYGAFKVCLLLIRKS